MKTNRPYIQVTPTEDRHIPVAVGEYIDVDPMSYLVVIS